MVKQLLHNFPLTGGWGSRRLRRPSLRRLKPNNTHHVVSSVPSTATKLGKHVMLEEPSNDNNKNNMNGKKEKNHILYQEKKKKYKEEVARVKRWKIIPTTRIDEEVRMAKLRMRKEREATNGNIVARTSFTLGLTHDEIRSASGRPLETERTMVKKTKPPQDYLDTIFPGLCLPM